MTDRRQRTLRRLVMTTLVSVLLAAALAQPYSADGGFDRPRASVDLTRGSLAVAVDAGAPRLLVGDGQGARLFALSPGQPLDAQAARWLAEATVVRAVAAASGWGPDGAAVYAWLERDTVSGHYRYWWQWGDERRPLLEALQMLDLALFVGAAGPEAWVAVPEATGGRLERHVWDASEAEEMLRSDHSLGAPTLARDAAGRRHLAFLEGSTIDSPVGLRADWSAVYVAPDGSQQRFEGAQSPPGRLVLDLGTPPLLLWPREDGQVIVSDLTASEPDVTLGPGRAVGVVAERAFRSSGASIVATDLSARGAPAAGAVNVAWSPYAVERARLLHHDGVTYLGWIGTLPGAGSRVLHSDDAQALQPLWQDHVAAWFGWTPWALAEEAVGQLTGALLVAVLATMVLFPLFWLVSLPLAQRLPEAWTRLSGAALAVASVLAIGVALVVRAAGQGHDASALLGGVWGFAVALGLGLALPPLLLRRVDLEPQPALLIAAALGSFVSLGLIAFVAFQPWLQVLGL